MAPPTAVPQPSAATRVPRRVLAAILLGTVLNPINSSMIAVALVRIRDDFDVSIVSLSWLISSFYLVAAVGQSVLGRLADQFGPRRVQCAGFVLIAVAGVLGPLAPSFGWLIAARLLLAAGTSAGFPAGLALLRNASGGHRPPPSTLAAITIGGSSSAALGPVIGGLLVALAGWQAIFYVNVVVGVVALPLSLRWLPRDPQHQGGVSLALVRRIVDLPGIAAFTVMLVSLLALMLSFVGQPLWWLAPVALLAGAALVVNDRRREDPFLDVQMLIGNRALLGVCAQYLLVNVVAFGVFFSLPLWLEAARGFSSGGAGLMVAPLAGVAVFATPLAARLVTRAGERPALLLGACAMVAGTLLLLTFSPSTPLWAIVPVTVVLGIPIGFNNLGLQSALYGTSDPARTGAAAGIFQTCRFIGAVLSTSLLGIVFADGVDSAGLHELAVVFAGVSVLVLLASLRAGPRRPR
ncbi:MAG TPA: MFS transporter [Conexibacter sp.]|jgi:MFS family permease|nr:MFS transporter [Conexibacter sp.]